MNSPAPGPSMDEFRASSSGVPLSERESFDAWSKPIPHVLFSDYAWQAWQARAGQASAEGARSAEAIASLTPTAATAIEAAAQIAESYGAELSTQIAKEIRGLSVALPAPSSEPPAAQAASEPDRLIDRYGRVVPSTAYQKQRKAPASTQPPTPAAASEPRAPVLTDEQCWALRGLERFNAVDETKAEFIERVRAMLAAAPTATGGAT